MLLLNIIKRVLLSLAPLIFFYVLRIIARKQQLPKKKTHSFGFDPSTEFIPSGVEGLRASKSRIEEAEIVDKKI